MRVTYKILPLFAAFVLVGAACGGGGDDSCGNGVCDSGETLDSCAQDCTCGNDVCDAGEDSVTCSADCPSECGNGACEPDEADSNANTYCADDCGGVARCGNDRCELGETPENCGNDCLGGSCGNGTCEDGEDGARCPQDCFECSLIGAAQHVGEGCSRDDMCGPGGACLDFGDGGQCYIVCSGGCDNNCASTEQCAPITGNGEAVPYLPGVDLAVCVDKPTGSQGEYDACGENDGACSTGLTCVVFDANATRGYCAPDCSGGEACPDREGVTAQCVVGEAGKDPVSCALLCTPGANAVCPAGMTCQDMGGGGVCIWQ